MKYFHGSLIKGINKAICDLEGRESVLINKDNLESALSPLTSGYDNVYVVCAKIFRNLIIAHSFQDANKRTACLLLRLVNPPVCSNLELAKLAIDVANGKYSRDIGDLSMKLYGDKSLEEGIFKFDEDMNKEKS